MEIFTMGGEERFIKAVNMAPAIQKSGDLPPVESTDKAKIKKAPFLKRVK
jgi:hypothetical protein